MLGSRRTAISAPRGNRLITLPVCASCDEKGEVAMFQFCRDKHGLTRFHCGGLWWKVVRPASAWGHQATLAAVWKSGLPLHRCAPVGDDGALLWKRAIRARTMGETFQRPDFRVATLPPASIPVCDNDHRRIPAFTGNILSNLICWRSQSPQGRPEASSRRLLLALTTRRR